MQKKRQCKITRIFLLWLLGFSLAGVLLIPLDFRISLILFGLGLSPIIIVLKPDHMGPKAKLDLLTEAIDEQEDKNQSN